MRVRARGGRSCALGVVLALALALGAGVSAPVASAEGGCANEALRLELHSGALPDCRAYEMVSPPFKNGYSIGVVGVSGDGSRVLVRSLGAVAGAESNANFVEGSAYEYARSGSGWVTSAVGPPASRFPAPMFFAASADLGRTLWAMRGPSQSVYAEDLYVREADGSFVKVGPMVPPSAAAGPPAGAYQLPINAVGDAGVSSDLSHVLFTIRGSGALWPGDTTVSGTNQSLYEYVGTGNRQPKLVGVNAEGHLISNCETSLGSAGSGETYNAVSADGETVFFTAGACGGAGLPVNEVYVRLGQSETVAISEPSSSQCIECSTGVKAPAEFQGASEDGSKVFFLTSQALFSGDETMNLYEYDFDNPEGRKVVRVSGGSATPEVLGVARVSLDGSHVYFVARAVLTEGKNAEGVQPTVGGDNLYVFERDAAHAGGRLAFIAMLSAEDSADWGTRDGRPVQATPDGRFLVFGSVADLTPGDTSTQRQVFEYDALRERLVRVSIGATGYASGLANANANGSLIPSQLYFREAIPPASAPGLAVSADGSRVVFMSVGALTPGAEEAAAAGAESVYEYRSTGSISNGNVYLISDGRSASSAELLGMGASGGDVFFRTTAPLLAQDVDTQIDVYDARVDGGFPAPVAPGVCAGQACQGALSGPPSFMAPGSASAQGGGNLIPPPPGAGTQPKARPLTRAQKLANALRVCKGKRKRGRAVCEARARKRYGVTNRSNGRGKGGR